MCVFLASNQTCAQLSVSLPACSHRPSFRFPLIRLCHPLPPSPPTILCPFRNLNIFFIQPDRSTRSGRHCTHPCACCTPPPRSLSPTCTSCRSRVSCTGAWRLAELLLHDRRSLGPGKHLGVVVQSRHRRGCVRCLYASCVCSPLAPTTADLVGYGSHGLEVGRMQEAPSSTVSNHRQYHFFLLCSQRIYTLSRRARDAAYRYKNK